MLYNWKNHERSKSQHLEFIRSAKLRKQIGTLSQFAYVLNTTRAAMPFHGPPLRCPNYITFCLDVHLDSLFQSNSVAVALVKGLEHVNMALVNLENRETNMKFG